MRVGNQGVKSKRLCITKTDAAYISQKHIIAIFHQINNNTKNLTII